MQSTVNRKPQRADYKEKTLWRMRRSRHNIDVNQHKVVKMYVYVENHKCSSDVTKMNRKQKIRAKAKNARASANVEAQSLEW